MTLMQIDPEQEKNPRTTQTAGQNPTTGSYGSSNSSLNDARDSALAAQDAATQAAIEALTANNANIAEQATAARRAAQANARLTALGSNEKLAALGLAGNAYAAPSSGFSETTRTANNNAYRGALNNVNTEENRALREIANLVAQAKAEGASKKAQLSSDWTKYMVEYEQALKQYELNKALQEAQLTGLYNGNQTLGAKQLALQEAGLTGLYNGNQTLGAKELALQEAGLTGTYNGVNTLDKQRMEAELTGQYNGADTVSGKLANAQIAYNDALIQSTKLNDEIRQMGQEIEVAKLTGDYKGAETLEKQMQKKLASLYAAQAQKERSLALYNQVAVMRGLQAAY